ncbi:hypothetical protein Tco_0298800 [Tanacetum coccineum]
MLLIEILHDVVGTSGYHCGVLRSFPVERIKQGNESSLIRLRHDAITKSLMPSLDGSRRHRFMPVMPSPHSGIEGYLAKKRRYREREELTTIVNKKINEAHEEIQAEYKEQLAAAINKMKSKQHNENPESPLMRKNSCLEVGWIRRIHVLDTAYWVFLGVGTTFDIFQNIILIPYLQIRRIESYEYGVLIFIPFVVFASDLTVPLKTIAGNSVSTDPEPETDDTENMASVPTYSNDPLLSGKDRLKLNELMVLCTSLSQRVLDLEKTKTSQAAEITELKKRIKKLEGKRKSNHPGMKRLFKIEVALVDETQGRNDEEMFDTEIKAAKPKAVTTAATITTTAVTRPKAKGVVVQEPSKFTTTTSPSQPSQLPQAKDKGKAKMVEPEKPLNKKDQIMFDKEVAQKLQDQLDAELEEEEKLARQREEDANIAKWDNVQAMIDADYELVARLQAKEQGELTIEEKSRLFVELMNKRKKHFARLRAEEQRRKPPTKAQKRSTMSTYLENMARYKHNQLKTKSFEDIQMLFDKEIKRVNTFVDMDTELVKGSKTRTKGSSKRAGEELESENLKKQKLDENVEAFLMMR